MDISDNQIDTESPNTTKSHDGDKEHDEDKLDQDKKHDTDEEPQIGPPDEGGPPGTPVRTASSGGANTDMESPPSSRSQKSAASSNANSAVSKKSGTSSSSDGSAYDRYSVQADALRIYRGSVYTRGDLPEFPQESTEHEQMRECVNVAMCILSRTRTRDAMAVYSIGLVDFMKTKHDKNAAGYLNVKEDEVPDIISRWLDFLKNQFPCLYISPSLGLYYGHTIRSTWGTEFNEYLPRSAALVSINSEVSSPLSL